MAKKEKMIGKEANEMAEIGFEMKGGKMLMVDEKAKTMTAMEKEMMLNDGTKVMTNGKVVKKDGTLFMLKEGESVWMDGTFMKAGEMMEKDEEGMMESSYTGKVLAGTASKYLNFKKADYEKALKENKKILLYFYANWCPICKKEQPETSAAFNELKDPALVGFRVNFKDSDTDADEIALAKEFGIAYQHTKVILKNGERVGKFPDSWDKERYLDELAKI
jgi:thiol-disulfide isomerase/thioredoxin